MTEMPIVELTDSRTGQSYGADEIMQNMSAADLAAIAAEMKRRCNLLLLPASLYYKGSEFRAFVDDFTAKHGEAPKFFSIGDHEMPIPAYWPEDAYYSFPLLRHVDGRFVQVRLGADEDGNKTCRT